MAKFCTNCGKKLKDGEVCNCKKVEISTKDFNSYMTSLLNVLKGMFVKPIDTLKSFIADSNFVFSINNSINCSPFNISNDTCFN